MTDTPQASRQTTDSTVNVSDDFAKVGNGSDGNDHDEQDGEEYTEQERGQTGSRLAEQDSEQVPEETEPLLAARQARERRQRNLHIASFTAAGLLALSRINAAWSATRDTVCCEDRCTSCDSHLKPPQPVGTEHDSPWTQMCPLPEANLDSADTAQNEDSVVVRLAEELSQMDQATDLTIMPSLTETEDEAEMAQQTDQ